MNFKIVVVAGAAIALMPLAAWADDPNDPAMRNPAALARDRKMTRQLNLEELVRTRRRDARILASRNSERSASSRRHDLALEEYNHRHAEYEQEMARWRRSVKACDAGDYSACDH